MSREKTKEEVRGEFIDYIRSVVDYWSEHGGDSKDVAEGVAFSILTGIDGSAGGLSFSLDLSVSVHPEDKDYYISEGENYYQDGMVINDDVHLHDILFK